MPVRGQRGKPNAGFPSFSTALGNRSAIPTFPQSRGERMEKWKSKGRIPTFPPHEYLSHPNSKKEPVQRSFCLLQAHSSIRKCWGSTEPHYKDTRSKKRTSPRRVVPVRLENAAGFRQMFRCIQSAGLLRVGATLAARKPVRNARPNPG